WLAALLAAAGARARAIGGAGAVGGVAGRGARRRRAAPRRARQPPHGRGARLRAGMHALPGAAHPHFSGASIAVTADTYRRVGGLEPRAALEDEAFAPPPAGPPTPAGAKHGGPGR